jgi:hypothetical protein
MPNRFRIHYTLAEARALLPQVRRWIEDLTRLSRQLAQSDAALGKLLATGRDVGGETADRQVMALAEFRRVLLELQRRDIQLKELERGLVDFPAHLGGREVFLCWEKNEPDITHWHDLEVGYAGREPLEEPPS